MVRIKGLPSLIVLIFAAAQLAAAGSAFERVRYSINDTAWKFKRAEVDEGYKPGFNDDDWLKVTIPHDFNGGIDGVHNDVFKGRFDFENDVDQRLMYKGPG